jgi:hypothetical protein
MNYIGLMVHPAVVLVPCALKIFSGKSEEVRPGLIRPKLKPLNDNRGAILL